MAAIFESGPCGRCGGSGMFGPLSVQAGRCFGCAGRGTTLTKKGAKAQALYRSLLPVKTAEDLKVGDHFRLSASDPWREVLAIEDIRMNSGSSTVGGVTTTHHSLTIRHNPIRGAFGAYSATGLTFCAKVTVHPGKEEVVRLQGIALQYQASLGKRGQETKASKRILDTIASA